VDGTGIASPDGDVMPETVRLDEQFYIVAEGERPTTALRVLKQGDSFGVFDPYGDVVSSEASEQGLYHHGTRFLSHLELLLGQRRPLLLNSTISEDNVVFSADLTNPDVRRDGVVVIPRGEIHIYRSRVLANGGYAERIRITNHSRHQLEVPIAIRFDADYADVFEVRGITRERRGRRLPNREGQEFVLGYVGLDNVERRTTLRWNRTPESVEAGVVTFRAALERHAGMDLEMTVTCDVGRTTAPATPYVESLAAAKRYAAADDERDCVAASSNESFNRWIRRSHADLRMMVTETPNGPYPYAGIPWFSTPFGRDGIITALELLWAAPPIARGVLTFLADTQAVSLSDAQDAQPGKILHEMRLGEMAALGEVPFGRYYGTADATPLFVMLAHAYYERTADRAFIDRLWPHVLAALRWIETYGDPDQDDFVEYARTSDSGLVQQGWKDSNDSVFHADGVLAEPPIALCEIQGYAYAAWRGASALADMRGDSAIASEWRARAERLRMRFEDAFWCQELGTYALALDGEKRRCRVRSSNPGHCLFTGIVAPERARQVADTLMSNGSFAGWGIRTIAAGEARYNPMSYHNGSIWPHDNALIAAGFARYGLRDEALRVMNAMFALSQVVDLHRLPELLCGFHRREMEFPTLYPVACAPQAWSAGAVYMLLGSCLGLKIDAVARQISFSRAMLPESIEWLRLTNLSVGTARVDLLLTRHLYDVGVTVLRRDGDVEIVAVK
jgi:glycogen debranching enzyme